MSVTRILDQKAYRRKKQAEYRLRNIDVIREKDRVRVDKQAANNARWYKENAGVSAAKTAARKAAILQATPAWADLRAIEEIYKKAAWLGLEVDHVYPLKGETVCGLHVENNLQLLTKAANCSKGNKVET